MAGTRKRSTKRQSAINWPLTIIAGWIVVMGCLCGTVIIIVGSDDYGDSSPDPVETIRTVRRVPNSTDTVPSTKPTLDNGGNPDAEANHNDDDGSNGSTGDGKTTVGGTVHPGAFCSPRGAIGYTSAGTRMVCAPAKDGRNRWQRA